MDGIGIGIGIGIGFGGGFAVEMEAAALFAISTLHGVDMASGFVIRDLLADLVWHPQILA